MGTPPLRYADNFYAAVKGNSMIYHGLKQSAESVIAELAQMAKDCPKDVLGNNARQWLIHCQDALGCFQRACELGMKSETPPSVSDVVGIYHKDAAEQAALPAGCEPFDLERAKVEGAIDSTGVRFEHASGHTFSSDEHDFTVDEKGHVLGFEHNEFDLYCIAKPANMEGGV